MAAVFRRVRRFVRREEGQDLVEYGLLAALIVLAAIGSVTTVGQAIYNFFWSNIAQASF